jgi:hypothetical protein
MKSIGSRLGFTARLVGVVGFAIAASQNAHAGFVDYIIRGTPTITYPASGQTEFVIGTSGDKAALGSNDINGATVGDIGSVKITRLDDRSRFLPPSSTNPGGQYTAPYLNLWITNGLGDFAVVADAPTEPNLMALYNNGYDLSFANLQTTTAYIYETSNSTWLANGAHTWASLSAFLIQAPTVAQFAAMTGQGTGAPRELGTNVAYGVNWVFGDTLSNYVSGTPDQTGYIVADAGVTTPEPGTFVLLGAGMIALSGVSRRRRS